MATVYYGVDRGGHEEDVVINTSTTGKNVELVVNEGVVLSRQELADALQAIRNQIIKQNYPFA
jgi:hypothetical protein